MKDYLRYKRSLIFYLLIFFTIPVLAQFAPAAGVQGTTAIHKDSSVFVNWATECSVVIGQEDISNPLSAYSKCWRQFNGNWSSRKWNS